MSNFVWENESRFIQVREDEFSWQGAHRSDPLVFFRRSKDDPREFTDLFLGSLPNREAKLALIEFFDHTGGLPHRQILLSAVGSIEEPHTAVMAKNSDFFEILHLVLFDLRRQVQNVRLKERGSKWDATIDFQIHVQ